MPPLIQLNGVTVGYDRTPVLEMIQLEIAAGEFVGLLGGNGSGKTTLLKTIVGILPPLTGRVALGAVQEREPVLAYVPQRETLDRAFLFTSHEVVLQGTCGRVSPGRFFPAQEKQWARECLRRVDALEVERSRFAELSGGQKQRVLIARALAVRPDVLCLDEPTSGLDAAATQNVLGLLHRLQQEHGLTVMMVSHDLAAVRQTARHVVWLHEGRVLQGTVEELLTRERIEEILNLTLR